MGWRRVRTIMLHSWYHMTHSMETWIDLFWFTSIDIVVFGFLTTYFIQENSQLQIAPIISGLLLWQVVRVGQYGVTISMMWDIWSKNFSSLFITPLSMKEFVFGQMLAAALKSAAVFVFGSILAFVFFGYNAFLLGPVGILYYLSLIIFAWAAGITIMGLIFRYGTNIQSLSWGLIFLFQPLSAIVYPVEALPEFMRPIAFLSPITYVMESMRSQLSHEGIIWSYILWSVLISAFYFLLSVLFFRSKLSWAQRTGAFARIEM